KLHDGSFVVVWSPQGADGSGSGVLGRHFAADGTAIGSEFGINTTTAGDQYLNNAGGNVAVLADGSLFAVYVNEPTGRDVLGQHFDAAGTKIGPEIAIANTSVQEIQPGVTALADGRMLALWATPFTSAASPQYAEFLNADGTAASAPIL